MSQDQKLATLTAKIVAAYVTRHVVPSAELSILIAIVHSTLAQPHSATSEEQPPVIKKKRPAVPLRQALEEHHITCLEDGLRFKSLARHLGAAHHMTPDQYRDKWALPADYPMVAPAYSIERSRIAKEFRFGHKITNKKKRTR